MSINSINSNGARPYQQRAAQQPANLESVPVSIAHEQRRAEISQRLGVDLLEANSIGARASIGIGSRVSVVSRAVTDSEYSSLTVLEKLALIEEEGKKVDRSGMSDKEIVEEMFTRFEKYLGSDLFPPYDRNPLKDNSAIASAENREWDRLGWSKERCRNAYNDYLGYSGMSANEMKQAITEKYASQNMSVADFCRMISEMRKSGAISLYEAADLTGLAIRGCCLKAENKLIKSGYSYDEVHGDYERIAGDAIRKALNNPVGIAAIFGDTKYMMTDGGWVNADVADNVYGFFDYLKGLGWY